MAHIFRIVGAIGLIVGLALIALALAPFVGWNNLAPVGPPFMLEAAAALVVGLIALGFGQLVTVNQRVADNIENLLDYIRRRQDEEPAPVAGSSHDVFANIPDYSPRRDPPIVKEGTYRDHTILTLEDGTVAVQTPAGWKRFRRIRDFERLLTA